MTHTSFFFFFNDTATTEIYTLSLHDALPISRDVVSRAIYAEMKAGRTTRYGGVYLSMAHLGPQKVAKEFKRSEEHTSELQSQSNLVCRLLLEKKKKQQITAHVIRREYIDTDI